MRGNPTLFALTHMLSSGLDLQGTLTFHKGKQGVFQVHSCEIKLGKYRVNMSYLRRSTSSITSTIFCISALYACAM